MIRNRLIAAIALLLCPFAATAQTTPPAGNPAITNGVVWTPTQWNSAWSAKQDFPATTAVPLLSWTTGARPSSPAVGWLGYNSTIGGIEVWNGSAWISGGGGGSGTVSSGTIHQLGVYAATGTTISGLATANSGVLVTSSSGVPSISSQISTAPAIAVSGSLVPANSGFFLSGTQTGTSSAPGYGDATAPMLYVKDTESVTSTTVSSVIDGLNVTHVFGTGEGNRNGINSVLVNTAPTAGATSDGVEFYTSIFGSNFIQSGDGGTSGTPKGDFYAFGGLLTNAGAGTHLHGMIGAEFDVSINSPGSSAEKVGLQLITVNGDNVKGSAVDAALLISGDNTISAQYDYGIVFGKPGFNWDVGGTLIGTYTTLNAMNAINGVDFHSVTFSGDAFKSNGFFVNQNGLMDAAFTQTGLVTFLATSPPTTPATGQYALWLDSGSGDLKGIDSLGNVTVLVPPSGGGSGTVNSGTAGQMTFYSSTGTAVSGNANATISSGALTLGVPTSVAGQLKLNGSSSGTITLTGAAAAGTYTLTLPANAGASGSYLQSNGSGTSSWVTPIVSGTSAQLAVYASGGQVLSGVADVFASGGILTAGAVGTQGSLRITGTSSGSVTLTTQSAAGTTNFAFPSTAGSSGQFLKTDGSGNTSWGTPTGSGTVASGTANFFTWYGANGTTVSDTSALLGSTASVTSGGWSATAAIEGDATGSNWGLSAYNSGSTAGGGLLDRVDNTNQVFAGFFFSTSEVGMITTNGTATTYGTSSDVRLKKNILALGNAEAVIDALKPSTWTWKSNGSSGVGFVAQDLYKVIPDAVSKGDDNPNGKPGDPGYKQWARDDSKIVPYIVADEQDLNREIADLTARLSALEHAAHATAP